MQNKKSLAIKTLSSCGIALIFAMLITILAGYLCGYRAILVNGWSAQPHISYQSLILTYKCKQKDLKVGDFITFTLSGNSYVTHQIVEIDYENDKIVCKGWHYNSEAQEYQHQEDSQTLKYSNVVGKVIYSNYPIGKTIYTLKGNKLILVAILLEFVILLVMRKEFSVEPKFK